MVVINFVFPEHENLPEVNHYISYFSMLGIVCFRNSVSIPIVKSIKYIEWHIMGTHFYNKKRFINNVEGESFLIHEYASLSTGKYKILRVFKDIIKRSFSHRPDYQLFLNSYIRSKMSIDGIPSELRDMGVSSSFIESRNKNIDFEKEIYDFAYVGSMAPERKIENFLDSSIIRAKSILLIGSPSEYLVKKYHNNVTFTGRMEQSEIPSLLAQVKVCVNYIPNVHPYNKQTSTKLIEYLTLGKDVISNKYEWVLEFIHYNNLKYETINDEFIYIHNDGKYLAPEWSSIISNLNITKKIKNEYI